MGCIEEDFGTWRSVNGYCEQDTAILVCHKRQGICVQIVATVNFSRMTLLCGFGVNFSCYPGKLKIVVPVTS